MEHTNFISYAQKEQFQNAGYIHIFASDRGWTNPIIDVAVKRKWVREHTNHVLDQELQTSVYSGATIFNNRTFKKDDDILHMDLRSAYPAYMVSEYKKPGNRREKWDFFVSHQEDKINLYEIEFRCHNDNAFVKWFINEVAYTKRKVVREEEYTSGRVKFFSSPELNMSDYVAKMLENEYYYVVSTTQFGVEDAFIDKFVNAKNVIDLYENKEKGHDSFNLKSTNSYKKMLNESSGWLQKVDRPTYYHMVQTVKHNIMKMIYDNDLFDNLISVMTDGVYILKDASSEEKINTLIKNLFNYRIKHKRADMKGELYSLGQWKHEMMKGHELVQKFKQTVRK